MCPSILRLLLSGLLVASAALVPAQARVAQAKIARVVTPVATLEGVQVRLEWPAQAKQGVLRLQAARADAPDLGYRFQSLDWQCPLTREGERWRCEGEVRAGRGAPMRLAIDLDVARTDARLARGGSAVSLHRDAATPDLTRIDLTRVPLAWTQALLSRAWADGRINAGSVDGRLDITAAARAPLRVAGPLRVQGLAFDTPDGTVAGENLGARLDVDARIGATTQVKLDGHLHGGEMLFGNAYVSLQQRQVAVGVDAVQQGAHGWHFSRVSWRDPGVLEANGQLSLTPDLALDAMDLRASSANLAPLRDGYLTGFLGMAGLSELQLGGSADVRLQMQSGDLREADIALDAASIDDPKGRFRFDGLQGDVRLSSAAPVASELHWRGGDLHGLEFGAARLPFNSADGVLSLREGTSMPMLGGRASFDHLQIRPPAGERGLEVTFGLDLDGLDIAQLSKALDWPAFTGQLTGSIPEARYANDVLDFEGGLSVELFGGRVQVSSLAMERPFGVAPTLSSDIAFENIDLEALTGVLGFGTITGKLDGEIGRLRLVDWQPVAFDAHLRTDARAAKRAGVRQRISQRAVQDLSSVSDASFMNSLQSQLIGLFDDFGYRRIGIACRLNDEVCEMDGLGSVGNGFSIVEGSGVPRLAVVGFNRRVDWPTLLERLEAASTGETSPVFD